jgi:hypothetical protein
MGGKGPHARSKSADARGSKRHGGSMRHKKVVLRHKYHLGMSQRQLKQHKQQQR